MHPFPSPFPQPVLRFPLLLVLRNLKTPVLRSQRARERARPVLAQALTHPHTQRQTREQRKQRKSSWWVLRIGYWSKET
jgi:hypothetical protein